MMPHSPWAPGCLPDVVVQVEVIADNLLGLQGSASQVTGHLIFRLEEAKAQPKLICSQHRILTEQL